MENTNLSLQEKIQALVAGELDDASRQALLKQAQADPDIADEIAFGQSLARALRYPDVVAASAAISAIMAEEGFPPAPPPAPTFSLRKTVWKWLGGAAVLLILSLGGYLVTKQATASATTSQQLGRAALEPLENVFSLPDNAQQLPDLQRAMTAYDARRHAEAIRAFEAYLAKRPDSAARLYLGVSYLLSGQADKAIQPLYLASLSEEPPLREAAVWYLALAYLEKNNTVAARQALSEMPPDGIYDTKAKALLDALPDN